MAAPAILAMGLLSLGLLLLALEAIIPGFGIAGISGLLALISGLILGIDSLWPLQDLPTTLLIGAVLALAMFGVLLIIMFWRVRRQPVTTGHEGLIGQTCTALEDFEKQGWVWLHGEAWQAVSPTPVTRGQQLTVTAIQGLKVYIQDSTSDK